MNREAQIIEWLTQDPLRLQVLASVYSLQLPEGYVAAGFVRNLVWDRLHEKYHPTPLNDVDVIYFDPQQRDPEREARYEAQLQACLPKVRWQVRNQARMHLKNGDAPYVSVQDAMGYWPEKETAVAVRQTEEGYEVISAFGLHSLFSLCLSPNSRRSQALFEQRLHTKGWLVQWPLLRVVDSA